MSKKKDNDNVFSFTLIDLLVQVIFLGIFVFAFESNEKSDAIAKSDEMKSKFDEYKADSGKYKELTDELTALSPNYLQLMKELQDKKMKGGLDKPSCLSDKDGKVQTLTNLRLVDNRIEVIEKTTSLEAVLKDLGFKFNDVKTMSPLQFKKVFGQIRNYKKDCVYYMGLCERSKDLELRDTVERFFYKKSCDPKFRKMASEG